MIDQKSPLRETAAGFLFFARRSVATRAKPRYNSMAIGAFSERGKPDAFS
jgi:hypothetical protein